MGLLIWSVRSAGKKQPPSGQVLNGKALVSFISTYGSFVSEASLLPSPLRFSHQCLLSSIRIFWALPFHPVFPLDLFSCYLWSLSYPTNSYGYVSMHFQWLHLIYVIYSFWWNTRVVSCFLHKSWNLYDYRRQRKWRQKVSVTSSKCQRLL